MASERDETIQAIKAALRRRSGKAWSVRGGRGTVWGWITITSPPARRGRWGEMTPEDCAELAELLGLDTVHPQGEMIPAQADYRDEYRDRAEGRTPARCGVAQWD